MATNGEVLLARLDRALPAEARQALRHAVDLAGRGGVELFLVGGAVRDLILGASHIDLDVVVEGDAIELAAALSAADPNTRLTRYPRFGTASVIAETFRIDFAQARTETYARAGALPQVRQALLDADLARRDFTINAMALPLTGMASGRLIDPHGGRRDLKAHVIRVLHEDSFRDDATRIMRAVRYAGRFGFKIEPKTLRLLRRGLPYLRPISGARLRRELERVSEEECVPDVLRLAGQLGVLSALHTSLAAGRHVLRAAEGIDRHPERDALLLCLLLSAATPRAAADAIRRLSLTRRQAEAVRGLQALRRLEGRLATASCRPSAVVRLLEPVPPVSVQAFARLTANKLAGQRARSYLDEWRHAKPCLNGRDVRSIGIAQGKPVGRALDALREARLDGRAQTRDDEEALVKKMLRPAARK
jgi:tRNA nucleotidyltransferase (CCA-adding enzyme)